MFILVRCDVSPRFPNGTDDVHPNHTRRNEAKTKPQHTFHEQHPKPNFSFFCENCRVPVSTKVLKAVRVTSSLNRLREGVFRTTGGEGGSARFMYPQAS